MKISLPVKIMKNNNGNIKNNNNNAYITNTETALRAAVMQGGSTTALLEDPEIFVIDSGATCHSTGTGAGLINLSDPNGSKTKMGNGAKVATKAIGSLPFEDLKGTKGTMTRVHFDPWCPVQPD